MFIVREDDESVEYYGRYTYITDAKRGIQLLVLADGYDDGMLATALAEALNAVPIAIERLPVAEPPVLSPGRLLAAKQAAERLERLAAILRGNHAFTNADT